MKIIKLTKGYEAIVDDSDYNLVSKHKWSYSNGYAVKAVKNKDGKWSTVTMHKFLTGFNMTDHKNRERLDNRRENLRESNLSQNSHNRTAQHNNTSGHKGVYFHKGQNKWIALIGVNNKLKHLGYFKFKEEAAEAYKKAANILHKEFTCTDFGTKPV